MSPRCNLMLVLNLAFAAVMASCFSPSISEGLSCGLEGACPAGQSCGPDNTCRTTHPSEKVDAGRDCVRVDDRCCDPGDIECLPPDASSPGGITFEAPMDILVGKIPSGIASGDVTGDGDVDLIVFHSNDTSSKGVMVFAGDGAGGFGTPMEILNGTNVTDLIVADLNQDGLQDLAVLSHQTLSVVMVRQVPGGFDAPVFLAIPPADSPIWRYLHYADVNGDGRKDLVAQEGGPLGGATGAYAYLPQHASIDGQYEAALEFQAVRSDDKSQLVDLNRDGLTDVISMGNNGVRYAQQSSEVPGTYGPGFLLLAQPSFEGQLIVSDLNADGALDITAYAGNGIWTILQDSGTAGAFLSPVEEAGGGGRAAGTDLNSDDRLDIVFSGGYSMLAEPPIHGSFVNGPDFAVLQTAFDIAAADFNDDGKPDLAILHRGDSQFDTNGFVRVYLQR